MPALADPDAVPARGLPARAGIGLKPAHVDDVLDTRPGLGFFEVHAENYMVDGGPLLRQLDRIRDRHPVSLHGVGLSLGGETAPDEAHLARLAGLIERFEPAEFSEHLAWSTQGGAYLADLLPLAYDRPALDRVCAHVDRVQERLRRRMLIENPATYLEFATSTMSETEFLNQVLRRTGCGLLLDLTNVHVACTNQGRDTRAYLDELPLAAVAEIHIAGFTPDAADHPAAAPLLIDTHGEPVAEAVWALLARVLARTGPRPTLLERDHDVPPLGVLVAEALRADRLLGGCAAGQSQASAA